MARVVKSMGPWQSFAISNGLGYGSAVLLARQKCLCVHTPGGGYVKFSGDATLRALARAILRTVPAPKKRNTKRRK